MKNITKKIALAIISLSFLTSASFAGEFAVTGGVKATYTILSSGSTNAKQGSGKGLGVSNEFSLGASGELDNGWKWTYNQNIDDATVQDDAGLAIDFGSIGKIAINVSQGGLSTKYGFDASAYGVGSDNGYGGGDTASGASANTMQYGTNISSYNNIQYHTPAGLLPFGIAAKVAVAPNAVVNANASSHATGTDNNGAGDQANEYQITAAPIDGLSIGASYFNKDGENGIQQGYEAGSVTAKYAFGPVTVGYGITKVALNIGTTVGGTAVAHGYDNKAMSLGFKANDDLSFSYTVEKSDKLQKRKATTAAVTTNTRSDVEMEIDTIQAAYTMGGMTLSLSLKDVDNDSYTANKKVSETIFAVAMAF